MPLIFLSGNFNYGNAAVNRISLASQLQRRSRRQIVKHALDSAKKRKIYNMLTDYREK